MHGKICLRDFHLAGSNDLLNGDLARFNNHPEVDEGHNFIHVVRLRFLGSKVERSKSYTLCVRYPLVMQKKKLLKPWPR